MWKGKNNEEKQIYTSIRGKSSNNEEYCG